MKIGYIRVSTPEQSAYLQEDALKRAGCMKFFTDTASGSKTARPGLEKAILELRKGDTLVVWRLDRLGRSLRHLIDLIKHFQDRDIGFCSLQENIDTTTSGGKLVFHIFSALAEFEREIIRERTKAGLIAARARGRKGGRPQRLSEQEIERLIELYNEQKMTVKEICALYKISRPTLYVYLKKYRKAF